MLRSSSLIHSLIVSLAFLGLVTGCASDSTLGEELVQKGETDIDLGKQWTKGQELIKEGNEDIAEGNTLTTHGRAKVQRGKEMVREVEHLRASNRGSS
jgi:hypothetical protein